VPPPVIEHAKAEGKTRCGVIHFGSTAPAVREALAGLSAQGVQLDTMRLRAFPFPEAVTDFINAYDQIFLVEQNRDAQMRSLLVNECGIDPARFVSVLHFDGTPITARSIMAAIAERLSLASKEAAE
jgi:2-oxoglutarate ferredoxin oxidoreductase subunit alpha